MGSGLITDGVILSSLLDTFTSEQSTRGKLLDFYNGGERHDYIYYFKSPRISCQQSRVVMKEYMPYTNLSYSDNFSVHCVFSITVYANQRVNHGFTQSSRLDFPKQTFKSQYKKEYKYDYNSEKQQPSSSDILPPNDLLPRYSKTEDDFGRVYDEKLRYFLFKSNDYIIAHKTFT